LLEWRNANDAAEAVRRLKAQRLSELSERMEKLEEAHIYQGSITAAVYERQRDKLQEEIALAELELHESRLNEIDVQGLLASAEHLVTNVGGIWIEASLTQRQEIQRALFPTGLPFHGQNFGTAVTCLMFTNLEGFSESQMNNPRQG
jgi:hypothetical protein